MGGRKVTVQVVAEVETSSWVGEEASKVLLVRGEEKPLLPARVVCWMANV